MARMPHGVPFRVALQRKPCPDSAERPFFESGIMRDHIMRWRIGELALAALLVGCAERPVLPPDSFALAQPAPVAVAPAAESAPTPPTGKFSVQIAAPRSVEEARAAIEAMRQRYPELAEQWAMISRVELPNGVFYRVLIGPLASERQATELCSTLKAKGAACFMRAT
jgi:SPOR domain